MKRASVPEQSLPLEFSEALDGFMAFLELEKGLSRHTLDSYEGDLTQFALFTFKAGCAGWQAVGHVQASNWIASLSDEDYAVASLARKLTALRGMAKFLVRERYRTDDFSELLQAPKLMRHLPGTLSATEVEQLLNAPREDTPHGLRDRAMLEMMYSSGLRVSELCGLQLTSVDTESGLVRVTGKGSKERVVPLGRHAIKALERYLEVARPQLVKPRTGSDLFLSQWGKAISRKTFWVIIGNYARACGLEKQVKPHLLRHSFASHLLGNGADLRVIQEMLGHADIATTQIYTHVQEQSLKNAHAQFHPRRG